MPSCCSALTSTVKGLPGFARGLRQTASAGGGGWVDMLRTWQGRWINCPGGHTASEWEPISGGGCGGVEGTTCAARRLCRPGWQGAAQCSKQSRVTKAHVLPFWCRLHLRMPSRRWVSRGVAAPQRCGVQPAKLLNDGNVAGVISEALLSSSRPLQHAGPISSRSSSPVESAQNRYHVSCQ